MEYINQKIPIFKKLDTFIFSNIEKFKKTPGYSNLVEIYTGLEEEQQKIMKVIFLFSIFLIPFALVSLIYWQNSKLKDELNVRTQIVSKASQIIGQKTSLEEVKPQVLASNPIDSESMMVSRLSSLSTGTGVELSKIKVQNVQTQSISQDIFRTDAKISFTNLSNENLIDFISTLMRREKFKISEISIERNTSSNLLNGFFQTIHLSQGQASEEGF